MIIEALIVKKFGVTPATVVIMIAYNVAFTLIAIILGAK